MYARRWGGMAALYFVVGSFLGLAMGITQKFEFAPPHAHLNLLGWVSMAVFALFYRAFPNMEEGILPAIHFWVYQVGIILFTFALFSLAWGGPLARIGEGLVAPGASITILGVILSAVAIWRGISSKPTAATNSQVNRIAK